MKTRRVVLGGTSKHFGVKDMLFMLGQPQRSWNPEIKLPDIRKGQLKLLAGCIALFTIFLREDLKGKIVIYAGASPGYNIALLSLMYEDLEMHLYDPRPFAIRESDRIHIHQELFTDEIANYWSQKENVIFISDIRSCTGKSREDFEDDVNRNMHMQKRWVQIIRPVAYFLKFRIPYTVIERGEEYIYLTGTLLYQPYTKPYSTEMRLYGTILDIDKPEVSYNAPILEKILFHHNSRVRPNKNTYLNVITGDNTNYEEFDRGYDSTYFLFVLLQYLKRRDRIEQLLPMAYKLRQQLTTRNQRDA